MSKLHQERIKTCNPKPKTFVKKLFKGYWGRPALLKNQSDSEQLPEPPSSPRSWKKCLKAYKPERFPSRVLWREMKGIWEKEGQIWKVGKHFGRFPTGRDYSRGIGDALLFSKTKVSSCQNHPSPPEAGKKIEKPIKIERSPSRVLWRKMKGTWEKWWEIWKVGKIAAVESQVEYHFVRFPKGNKLF